jgi:hypothetical protein
MVVRLHDPRRIAGTLQGQGASIPEASAKCKGWTNESKNVSEVGNHSGQAVHHGRLCAVVDLLLFSPEGG